MSTNILPPPILTDLPDSLSFERRLVESMIESYRNKDVLAVMLVSLHDFDIVRGTFGRLFADLLFQEVAYRMTNCLQEGDAVAHVGGDEFVFMLASIAQVGENELEIARRAHARAHDVLNALATPFDLGGNEIFLNASGGLSLYPFDGSSSHVILKNVSAAVAHAKEQGRNNCHFYTAELDGVGRKRLALETGLRRALDKGELVVHYQPKVESVGGQIVGAEALVRWQHPELGLLPPSDFIPFAEETGLIVPLSMWVLQSVCEQSIAWQKDGITVPRVSINLSPRHFQQAGLVAQIGRVLDSTGLAAQYLEFEVTESSIMREADFSARKLRELKSRGVTISVDDFGTGYSSLGYLKVLPIDALKIDKSFVQDMTFNGDDEAIVSAVIGLAHTLRLRVVAEGVETEAQASLLRNLRCDEMQGYLFSTPVPAPDFRRLISK